MEIYTVSVEDLRKRIVESGGFVNAHAHLDRANTAHFFCLNDQYKHLKEKWQLVDQIKAITSYREYKERIRKALHDQSGKGVSHVCSFIDIDDIVSSKAIISARELAKEVDDIRLVIASQTLKGVLGQTQEVLIRNFLPYIDIIGSLPGADKGQESEHLDKIMNWAKEYDKRVHVHVDQLNIPTEKETELLARKTIQHGLEGKVTAVHSISLACHQKSYREEVYRISKDAGLSFITCPSAWIDHQRSETLMPFHNAVTPVDELIQHDLIVAIGSDNINDVYKPYSDGNMMFELRMLLESCKIYDENVLFNIATQNGLEVLGLKR
tara:strand:+ start:257 stop:1228 length:972 start_codon:yes stop_codon:yes gene_type:complete